MLAAARNVIRGSGKPRQLTLADQERPLYFEAMNGTKEPAWVADSATMGGQTLLLVRWEETIGDHRSQCGLWFEETFVNRIRDGDGVIDWHKRQPRPGPSQSEAVENEEEE